MRSEILPVSIDHKRQLIDFARDSIIPSLSAGDYSAEHCLQIFHQVGTLHSPPLDLESAIVLEGYKALFAGVEPGELLEFQQLHSDRFSHYDSVHGGYRILGCFPPNPRMAPFALEAENYFLGAIPVSTKDYHHPTAPDYYPPIFNIHKLMFNIGLSFDTSYQQAMDMSDVSQAVAEFYFWGLVMVHPYLGANHRAFDRFTEYAFSKKGFNVRTPLDATLNIPKGSRFNLALYKQRKFILEQAGLAEPHFSTGKFSIYNPEWLTYQHQLGGVISDCLNERCVSTDEVAEALMSWR